MTSHRGAEFLEIRLSAPHRGTSADIAALLEHCSHIFDLVGDSSSTTRYLGPDAVGELPSEAPLEDIIKEMSLGRAGVVWFQTQHIEFGLHIHPETDDPATFTVSIPDHYLRSSQNGAVQLIVDELVVPLYNYIDPTFVYGGTYLEDTALEQERIEAGHIDRAYWLLAFGPQLVRTLGREPLDGISAWRFEDLSDGGCLILLSDNPNTCQPSQRADAEIVLQEECGP